MSAKGAISVFPDFLGGSSEYLASICSVWSCCYSAGGGIISTNGLEPCSVPVHVLLEQEGQDLVLYFANYP